MNNKGLIVACILLLSGAFARNGAGQWVRTNAPYETVHRNRTIASLGGSETSIFAGTTNDTLFRSTDNGATWSAIPAPTKSQIRSFVANGPNLLAITTNNVIFLTTNNGTSWSASAGQGLTNTDIRGIVAIGGNLLAGTSAGGVFHSTNNGASWTPANFGIPNTTVNALAVIGTTVLAGTQYGGIFASTDQGASWSASSTGMTSVGASAFGVNGSMVFAATNDSGVFISTDNGAHWSSANTGLPWNAVFAFAAVGGNMFAATNGGGVYLTTNNGTSWTVVNNGLPTNSQISGLVVGGTSLFGLTADGRVYLTSNGGTNWVQANTGFDVRKPIAITALLTTGSDLYAGTAYHGVYHTTDNGDSWTAANAPFDTLSISSLASIGTTIFATTISGSNDSGRSPSSRVYRSDNKGMSWVEVYRGFAGQAYIVTSGTNLFVAIDSNVFRSTDNGTNWTLAKKGLPDANFYTIVANGPELFLWMYFGGIGHSTDNGSNWDITNTGWRSWTTWLTCATWIGTTVFAGTPGDGIYYSSNDGASWLPESAGGPGYVSALLSSGTNLIAGGWQVSFSTNAGTDWKDGGFRGSTYGSNSLAMNQTFLFASRGLTGDDSNGVWRRSLPELLSSNAVVSSQPIEHHIAAYPNPLTRSTTISFTSTESGAARVTIVNLLGQEVSRLFDGELEAGERLFPWDARGVAPGTYWCEVRMNGRVKRAAMVVER